MRKRYSGRSELCDKPQFPDLSKTPYLRNALAKAVIDGQLPAIAEAAGCRTEDLKPFIRGAVSAPPAGMRSRLIAVLSPST